VYLHRTAFGEHYNAGGIYIGLPRELADHHRFVPVSGTLALSPTLTLETCQDRNAPYEQNSYGMYVRRSGSICPETFTHELYLVVQEGEKRICFSGCAHRGVENIVHWLAPSVLVGGFHFKPLPSGDPRLELAARRLLESPCDYFTCHCTGEEQYQQLKKIMRDRIEYLSCGECVEI
jgi:7,8-dihydropterin-6-yl-methyl-4-(beta-D-ribofuranosyl)aminobenzene 5'-phosphate synthase